MSFITNKQWQCPACTFLNFHGLNQCEICETKRPEFAKWYEEEIAGSNAMRLVEGGGGSDFYKRNVPDAWQKFVVKLLENQVTLAITLAKRGHGVG
jgi:hypothetical protein